MDEGVGGGAAAGEGGLQHGGRDDELCQQEGDRLADLPPHHPSTNTAGVQNSDPQQHEVKGHWLPLS